MAHRAGEVCHDSPDMGMWALAKRHTGMAPSRQFAIPCHYIVGTSLCHDTVDTPSGLTRRPPRSAEPAGELPDWLRAGLVLGFRREPEAFPKDIRPSVASDEPHEVVAAHRGLAGPAPARSRRGPAGVGLPLGEAATRPPVSQSVARQDPVDGPERGERGDRQLLQPPAAGYGAGGRPRPPRPRPPAGAGRATCTPAAHSRAS